MIVGFCSTDVKPLGPTQLKVEPAVVVAVRFNALPEHTIELLVSVGAGGVGLITTTVVADELHVPSIAVTVYVPDAPVVTDARLGFCNVDVKPPGPDQK